MKKSWKKPEIIVIVRSSPGEKVLTLKCKYKGTDPTCDTGWKNKS